MSNPDKAVDAHLAGMKRAAELEARIKELEAKVASMEEDVAWLGDLENAGVDNWQGIDYAHELKREREAEEAEDG